MDPTAAFSSKAENYARYRWSYAPQAIEVICQTAALDENSTVADIGAGSGILTRHLIGKAGLVLALEPNAEMRRMLEQELGTLPGCRILNARAEDTTLPTASIDLITAATAANWFDPQPTRAEFLRILKPGGWLAFLTNRATGPDFGPQMAELFPAQDSAQASMPGAGVPPGFYFGNDDYQQYTFPFQLQETWQHFLGGLTSTSYAPDEGQPAYPAFERAARRLFDRFSQDGLITLHGLTQLTMGVMRA
jgi:SAM-dependent methyltransferase